MEIEQRIESFSNSRKICFEKQILSYNTYLLNKDILDIGSNIGLISLAICNNLKYKSIHLFEPNPHYLSYSKKILTEEICNFINNMDQYLCKIIKLDDYYKNIDNIDFIKIDVEGYEAYVIEGAFELIKKFKPYIYVEVGWGTEHPYWNYNIEIYNKLFDIGYKKIEFSNKTEDILFEPI